MRVFILGKQTYTEGNFGDTEFSSYLILGVYTSLELAEQAKSKVPVTKHIGQFSETNETCDITPIDLNDEPFNPIS